MRAETALVSALAKVLSESSRISPSFSSTSASSFACARVSVGILSSISGGRILSPARTNPYFPAEYATSSLHSSSSSNILLRESLSGSCGGKFLKCSRMLFAAFSLIPSSLALTAKPCRIRTAAVAALDRSTVIWFLIFSRNCSNRETKSVAATQLMRLPVFSCMLPARLRR